MATRSTIALEYADGTIDQVYCHWDGYLSGVGADLEGGYSDPFRLQELIDGGDMSCIGEPYKERGEAWDDVKPRRYANFDKFRTSNSFEEYNYILRNINGKAVWFVRCYVTDGEFVTMEEAAEMEAA